MRLPLLLNAGLFVLLAIASFASNSGSRSDALLMLGLLVIGLGVLNLGAVIVAAIMGKGQWAAGFALSMGLLFLVGLGTCGLMATPFGSG